MTREEAIKGLKVLRNDFSGYKPNEEMFDMAIEALEAQRWIPCSERLPEEDGRYLITGRRGTVYSLEYEDGFWINGIQALAWMPMPEPYTEEET